MLDRLESISRLLCYGLGALLLLEVVNAALHGDPLGRVTIPDLPTLPATASTASDKTNSPVVAAASGKTNSPAVSSSPGKTNSAPLAKLDDTAKTNSTSLTNATASSKTNSVQVAKVAGPHPHRPQMTGGNKVNLPPGIQSRVDHIIESEILVEFIRPMPMALLGIAGDDAFLRAPDGQTGMVKEGADLGSIKLLRIGTNRVLVEENGEKKELTLFAGMGGESLLSQETNSAVNTNATVKNKEKL